MEASKCSASSPNHPSPLAEMLVGALMAFIHQGLLSLITLLGCSQLSTTASQSGLPRDDATSPSVLSRETSAEKSRDLRGLQSSCSPPSEDHHTQPCRAALSALPGHRQSQGRTLLGMNLRCKLWYNRYTSHFSSISISHCKGAETAVFIFFSTYFKAWRWGNSLLTTTQVVFQHYWHISGQHS